MPGFKIQERNQMTLASDRSFSTSSSTLDTMTPALRFGGSSTDITLNLGSTSTPRPSGVNSSIGFFFDFIMLGSVAYLLKV